jgi:5-methylthioadenosine/S-adenosylhomocysteine deaminase
MATRLGARAVHLGHLTGTLEPGKRADLIVLDLSPLHNAPRFHRHPEGVYAQVVYAAKSTDVTDVMVDGRWLMRDRTLTALDEEELLRQAADYARKIDQFLIRREKSVLSKLIAIEGATEEESFEVQAKVRIQNREVVLDALKRPEIEILYRRHYHEYDTYFHFADADQGRLRYREDEYLGHKGEIENVRYRLTMIGPAREREFPSDVLLSRSRYLAQATHSLRFYREYFDPVAETYIEKDRLRWRVIFQGTEFYINLDRLEKPDLGTFLEVKSRTWSLRDAEHKAHLARVLIDFLVDAFEEAVTQDYIELVEADLETGPDQAGAARR